jgi:hypothetical protein
MRVFIILIALLATFSPALAQERQWSLDASEREAYLVFGVPDTDDVGLSFWCEIGKGKVSIFEPISHTELTKDQKIRIDLTMGEDKFNIVAKASTTPDSRSASLEAQVAVDGTVMQAASKAQTIAVSALGHKSSYPMFDADVDGLLRVCSGEVAN